MNTKISLDFPLNRVAGVTLLEILISLAILSILAAIAYPSYVAHLRKAHRNDAKVVLMETVQYLERYYATHNTYVGAQVNAVSDVSPKNADLSQAKYRIRFIVEPTATTYSLQASPVNAQEADECGVLSVDQLGSKTARRIDCW
ncbi:MAG: type IV pilin protein [Oxalobacter sp.]|nr:MAG: type IV pilin protein [Oxalobacter sp.]